MRACNLSRKWGTKLFYTRPKLRGRSNKQSAAAGRLGGIERVFLASAFLDRLSLHQTLLNKGVDAGVASRISDLGTGHQTGRRELRTARILQDVVKAELLPWGLPSRHWPPRKDRPSPLPSRGVLAPSPSRPSPVPRPSPPFLALSLCLHYRFPSRVPSTVPETLPRPAMRRGRSSSTPAPVSSSSATLSWPSPESTGWTTAAPSVGSMGNSASIVCLSASSSSVARACRSSSRSCLSLSWSRSATISGFRNQSVDQTRRMVQPRPSSTDCRILSRSRAFPRGVVRCAVALDSS